MPFSLTQKQNTKFYVTSISSFKDTVCRAIELADGSMFDTQHTLAEFCQIRYRSDPKTMYLNRQTVFSLHRGPMECFFEVENGPYPSIFTDCLQKMLKMTPQSTLPTSTFWPKMGQSGKIFQFCQK